MRYVNCDVPTEQPYGSLNALLTAEIGHTQDEARAALVTEAQPKEGRPGKLAESVSFTQTERAQENGIGRDKQRKLDYLAGHAPELLQSVNDGSFPRRWFLPKAGINHGCVGRHLTCKAPGMQVWPGLRKAADCVGSRIALLVIQPDNDIFFICVIIRLMNMLCWYSRIRRRRRLILLCQALVLDMPSDALCHFGRDRRFLAKEHLAGCALS